MPKGYTAVFDNQDGSFDYICHAEVVNGATEESVEKMAIKEGYDNERIRVYPYNDSPYEVL